MNNFELIDDYLTNRLGASEKSAFESALASDAELKAEVSLQKAAIDGVKKARAAELKAMLNQVPVGTTVSMQWSVLKIAAGVLGAGLLIAGLAYYFRGDTPIDPTTLSTSIEDSVNKKDAVKESTPQQEPVALPEEKTEKKEEIKTAHPIDQKKEVSVTPAVKPTLELADPTQDELNASPSENTNIVTAKIPTITASHISVETDASNKKHSFHYQFAQGKLLLYGNFDKVPYEILEVNGEQRAMFLYYKELYYFLDEKQSVVTLLEPIKDKTLISKLKEYRGR